MTNLTPLPVRPKTYNIVGFDVETEGPENNYVLGVVSDWDGSYVFDDKEENGAFLLRKKYRDARICATNLQFDLAALYYPFSDGWELLFNGGNLFAAIYSDVKYTDGKGHYRRSHFWRFLDTLNLNYHMSVEKMGKAVGLPKLDKPKWLGRAPRTLGEWDELEEYCQRDAEITRVFMEWFQSVLNGMGARLKYTAPSVAMDYWRMHYLPRPIKQPDIDILPYFYEGYYGGRTEVFLKGTLDGPLYYYDVNSLYPHVMKTEPYPDVDAINYNPREYDPEHIWEHEGMSKVTVRAPDMYCPILPFKYDHKTLFPTGEITGAWCHNELRYALRNGYEILDWDWTIWYHRTRDYFSEFVTDLYARRLDHQAEGNPIEIIDKFLMNSLYGRFALKLDGDGGILEPMDNYLTECEDIRFGCWRHCDRKCLVGKTLYQDRWVVKKFSGCPNYVNPIISAYTTAGARVHMHRHLSSIGTLAYTDTDSFISREQYPTDTGLGGLKLEHGGPLRGAVFIRPKLYEITTKTGKIHRKAKGVPKGPKNRTIDGLFRNMRHGDPTVRYEKFLRFRESQARHLLPNQRVKVKKTLNLDNMDDKRRPVEEVNIFNAYTDTVPRVFSTSNQVVSELIT